MFAYRHAGDLFKQTMQTHLSFPIRLSSKLENKETKKQRDKETKRQRDSDL